MKKLCEELPSENTDQKPAGRVEQHKHGRRQLHGPDQPDQPRPVDASQTNGGIVTGQTLLRQESAIAAVSRQQERGHRQQHHHQAADQSGSQGERFQP